MSGILFYSPDPPPPPYSGSPVLWLDGSQETGYADEEDMPTILDRSGNGNHLVQDTVIERPHFNSSLQLQNGLTNIWFGVGMRMDPLAFTLTQPCTVFFCHRKTDWDSARDPYFDGYTTARSMAYEDKTGSTGHYEIFAGGAGACDVTYSFGWFIIVATFNGASSSIQVNDGTPSVGDPGSAAPGGFTLGSDAIQTGHAPNNFMGEILIYNSVEDPAANVAYLKAKWAI